MFLKVSLKNQFTGRLPPEGDCLYNQHHCHLFSLLFLLLCSSFASGIVIKLGRASGISKNSIKACGFLKSKALEQDRCKGMTDSYIILGGLSFAG